MVSVAASVRSVDSMIFASFKVGMMIEIMLRQRSSEPILSTFPMFPAGFRDGGPSFSLPRQQQSHRVARGCGGGPQQGDGQKDFF
jgi:hypothetical protein